MNTQLSFHSPKPYTFYFNPNPNPSPLNPHQNKENLPNLHNKPNYQFFFKAPSTQPQSHIPLTIPLKNSPLHTPGTSFPKIISKLVDFTELENSNFETFLGAAIIYFKFTQKTQIPQNQLTTIALSCLLISSKLYEIKEISVGQLSEMTGNEVSKEEILFNEGWIMEKLKFDLGLERGIQKEFEKVFDSLMGLEGECVQRAKMVIQVCLLRGSEIFQSGKYIKWIGKMVQNEEESEEQVKELREYLRGIRNRQQLRSLLMKWSFKIDTDSTVSKLQI